MVPSHPPKMMEISILGIPTSRFVPFYWMALVVYLRGKPMDPDFCWKPRGASSLGVLHLKILHEPSWVEAIKVLQAIIHYINVL